MVQLQILFFLFLLIKPNFSSGVNIPVKIIEKNTNDIFQFIEQDVKYARDSQLNYFVSGNIKDKKHEDMISDEKRTKYQFFEKKNANSKDADFFGSMDQYVSASTFFFKLKSKFGEKSSLIAIDRRFKRLTHQYNKSGRRVPELNTIGILKTIDDHYYTIVISVLTSCNFSLIKICEREPCYKFLFIHSLYSQFLWVDDLKNHQNSCSLNNLYCLESSKRDYCSLAHHYLPYNEELFLSIFTLFELGKAKQFNILSEDFSEIIYKLKTPIRSKKFSKQRNTFSFK